MAEQRKIRKTVKKFLSPTPYEYGSVSWEVVVDPKDTYELIEANLRIADCNEHINLSFASIEKKHIPHRIAKLDVLIKSLQDMRALLTSDDVTSIVKEKIKTKEAEDKARKSRKAKQRLTSEIIEGDE